MSALCLCAGIVPSAAFVVDGGITSGSPGGSFIKLDSTELIVVGNDTFDSPDLYAFDEAQNIRISDDISVDIAPDQLVIPKGTVVAAHYVFFDPSALGDKQVGFVDFDSPILGIVTQSETMAATDFLATGNAAYLQSETRGLEGWDFAWIDPENPSRLRLSWVASSPGDYIRVLTSRSPGL